MTTEHACHPNKLEHAEQRRIALERRKRELSRTASYAQDRGLKFLHLRNERSKAGKGGATLAYRELGKSIIEVSVALCHHNDSYCKASGRIKACENHAGGRHVAVRMPPVYQRHTGNFLRTMFYDCANYSPDQS
jgi:DUF1365 family protein